VIYYAEREIRMTENYIQSDKRVPKIAKVSMYLGISSLIVLLASVVLGFLIESIGIVSFFSAVSILALASIVCSIIARSKILADKLRGIRTANAGLILGAIALSFTIFLRIAIFLFFIPWLGA
jgi:hypothetical protein